MIVWQFFQHLIAAGPELFSDFFGIVRRIRGLGRDRQRTKLRDPGLKISSQRFGSVDFFILTFEQLFDGMQHSYRQSVIQRVPVILLGYRFRELLKTGEQD